MAAVQMPDGAVVEMPDQLDPALGARLRAFQNSGHKSPDPTAMDYIKGAGDAALSGVSKLATSVVAPPAALINRIGAAVTGGDPQAAADATRAEIENRFGWDTHTPIGQQIGGAVSGALAPIGQATNAVGDYAERGLQALGVSPNEAHAARSETGEVLGSLPIVGAVGKGAEAAADASRLAAQNAAKPLAADQINEALRGVGYQNLPRQAPDSTAAQRLGAKMVGEPSLTGPQSITNQAVTDTLAGRAAGVEPGKELNYQNLADARANGPGKVYGAARAALPDSLAQDAPLQQSLASIGDTTSQLPKSPDVDALKSTMLAQPNMTKDELFANIQQARDRAAKFYRAEEPDAEAMGDAYSNVAKAYEDFVGRQLQANPGSAVSLGDWQNARTQFAKNYAVQSALKGTSVDASKLALLQRKEPGLLNNELQLIAEQANRYPVSTRFGPNTLDSPGIGASGSTPGIIARHVIGPAGGAAAGAMLGGPTGAAVGGSAGLLAAEGMQGVLRRWLSSNPEAAAETARLAATNPKLAAFFDNGPSGPPDSGPLNLTPPPSPPTAPPPAPRGMPGQVPLADVLAHGVEQPPESGLSLADEYSPPQNGVPFRPNVEHMAGGLQLAPDQERSLGELLNDVAAVRSQGVPDGTMTRTPQPRKINKRDVVDFTLQDRNAPTLADLIGK